MGRYFIHKMKQSVGSLCLHISHIPPFLKAALYSSTQTSSSSGEYSFMFLIITDDVLIVGLKQYYGQLFSMVS